MAIYASLTDQERLKGIEAMNGFRSSMTENQNKNDSLVTPEIEAFCQEKFVSSYLKIPPEKVQSYLLRSLEQVTDDRITELVFMKIRLKSIEMYAEQLEWLLKSKPDLGMIRMCTSSLISACDRVDHVDFFAPPGMLEWLLTLAKNDALPPLMVARLYIYAEASGRTDICYPLLDMLSPDVKLVDYYWQTIRKMVIYDS
jgi:hypothetical protein